VVTSPKVRAVETAERLAAPANLKLVVDERLANGVGLAELGPILEDAGYPSRPVLVGHDPDFSSLLELLTGVRGAMSKGAFARIAFELPISEGSATLDFLLPPGLLPR
jgi:phosphohistidine phosphatase SixA